MDELPQLTGPDGLLAGTGTVRGARIEDAIRRPEPQRTAAELERAAPRLPGLRTALAAWLRDAGPATVQRQLDDARERALLARFRADPLGVSVPLAWDVAKQREARRLRLTATSAARAVQAQADRRPRAA